MHRLLRSLFAAAIALIPISAARATDYFQVPWGIRLGVTPSTLCYTTGGDACKSQIGQINSTNVWTPTLRSVFGASARNSDIVCDGTTNTATAMQAALNANAGGTLYIPYTGSKCIINTVTLTQPSPAANVVVDSGVDFGGTGSMPQLLTNTFQTITGSFLAKTFTGAAFGQTLGIEAIGTAAYTGNAVALYLGTANATTSGAINGNYLAFNPVAISNPGSGGTGAVVNTEFDCNENRVNNFLGCIHIAGIGGFDPQYGILMDYNGSAVGLHNFTIGYIGRNFTTGIYLDATQNHATKPAVNGLIVQGVPFNSVNLIGTGADANVGVTMSNIKQNHIAIFPSVDAVGVASLVGWNHAATSVNWSIQTDGLINAKNLSVASITGYMKAAGAGVVTAQPSVPLSDLATQATNTIVGNATSGSAAPTALAIATCSASTSALTWTTNSGFGCNTLVAGVANPTATIGLTAVNGSAATAMRSDAAPALSQSIVPTWTGIHTFSAAPVLSVGAKYSGSGSGTVTVTAQAAAGTPTVTWGTATGTPAVTASSPLAINTGTGNITCTTCATTTNGGALSATGPLALSVGGAFSITGAAGQVLAGASPAFTATPTLGVAGSTLGTIALANLTSGSVTLQPVTGALGSAVLSLPAATDTLIGKATTDTLTNKTYDTAGTGNSFSINGLAATANTGTGAVARATSPTFVTPTLGAATATTINKVTVTAPASAATLTVADGASLITSGAFATTLTSTATTNSTLPAGTHTLAGLDVAQTFSASDNFTGGLQISGNNVDGAWVTSFVPVVTSTGGAVTATAAMRYKRIDKTIVFAVNITFTASTGTGAVNFTLPFTSANGAVFYAVAGRQVVGGNMVIGQISNNASTAAVVTYNNLFPGSATEILTLGGQYEAS